MAELPINANIFPELSYDDVYEQVYGAGGRSARGAKRMISTRLRALGDAVSKDERIRLTREIDDLVEYLYESH